MAEITFPEAGTELTHLFVVSDMQRSRDFYRDVLGANVYREYGGTSVVLQLLGTWLLLVTPGGPTADKPDVDFVAPDAPQRVNRQLIFNVRDCRGTYALLKARGATFLTPPVDHGVEIRCFFRDPDGHLFELSQSVPAR